MECPLWRLLISSRSVSKHGYHRNLVGSIYGMSSMKIAHFVPIVWQAWPPHAILVSDWSISKKSSPLKLLSHMNRNLVGSIYMYMEDSVLSFLKAEWKVSDTGSAHSASSSFGHCVVWSVLRFTDSDCTFGYLQTLLINIGCLRQKLPVQATTKWILKDKMVRDLKQI